MADSWQFFTRAELACRHCGEIEMNRTFMAKLEAMRRAAGFPFIVTSAYRCPEHNQRVSSTGPTGAHTTGRAVDIAVRGERAYWIVANAYRYGFTGVGVQQKGGSRFVHLDDLTAEGGFPRPNVWSY